jgi:poly(3-hydroxybutyrate) depolymerase
VLEIHGLRDPVVPFGGRSGDHSGSVASFVTLWRGLDGCRGTGSRRHVAAHTIQITWPCAGHTEVSQRKIFNIGHVWPGSPPAGRVPGSHSATTVIWRFFRALRAGGASAGG